MKEGALNEVHVHETNSKRAATGARSSGLCARSSGLCRGQVQVSISWVFLGEQVVHLY